jgi:pimeloyl-ACP methyl ester carboxylesterase
MQRKSVCHVLGFLALAGASMAWASSPSVPPKSGVDTGTSHGAPYRIDIPSNWNGDLVVLMHGYELKGERREDPWPQEEETPVFLSRGYAVAASAYASQGWAVDDALINSEQLRRQFVRDHGQPHHTYVVGFSLGGLDALAMLEREGHAYDGALSLCGANVSSPDLIARAVVEPLAAFNVFFPGVLPDPADPASPPKVDPKRVQQALQSDPAKAALLEKRLQETDASLPDALILFYAVLHEIRERAGGTPVDTTKTVYRGYGDDAEFNRKVRRYVGSPSAMAYLSHNVTLTGRISAPAVLQWNAFDSIVPPRFDAIYPHLAQAAGDGSWVTVLPSVGQGHCQFSPEQVGQAFDALVQRVRSVKAKNR